MQSARAQRSNTSKHRRVLIASALVLAASLVAPDATRAQSGAWIATAPMPAPRYAHALAEVDGLIHMVAGADGSPCSSLTTHDLYDPVHDVWTSKAPMSVPRAFPGAASLDGLLYVVGGTVGCGGATTSLEVYNPATNTWTTKAAMSFPRNNLGVAALDGKLYAVGGLNGGPVDAVERYDPVANAWTTLTSLPQSRNSVAIGAINGKLYVAGGDNGAAFISEVDVYDPATNVWTAVGAPMLSPRDFVASAVVDNRLYVAGGDAGAGFLTTVDHYDAATGTWTADSPLPSARSQFAGASLGTTFYVFGGYSSTLGILGDGWSLDVGGVADTTSPVVIVPAPLVIEATGPAGTTATFTVTAADPDDPAGAVICAPASGSTFALGTTTVDCSSTDTHANTGHGSFTVTVHDTTPPALALPASITTNATSPSGAVVVYAAAGIDLVSGAVLVTCSSPSGATFAVGTTNVECTAADASGNLARQSFSVTVLSAAEIASNLFDMTIDNFPQASQLLRNVLGKIASGDTEVACNQLDAFINQVEAQSGKKLTAAEATDLMGSATAAQAALGCP